jgi:hypothetical protein
VGGGTAGAQLQEEALGLTPYSFVTHPQKSGVLIRLPKKLTELSNSSSTSPFHWSWEPNSGKGEGELKGERKRKVEGEGKSSIEIFLSPFSQIPILLLPVLPFLLGRERKENGKTETSLFNPSFLSLS